MYEYIKSLLAASLSLAEENGALKERIKLLEQQVAGMKKSDSQISSDERLYDVFLSRVGENKIECIKIVRRITGYELKACRDIVEGKLPVCVTVENPISLGAATDYVAELKISGSDGYIMVDA
jgi:ribosomal protein L7/L12